VNFAIKKIPSRKKEFENESEKGGKIGIKTQQKLQEVINC
jgi:hypothetical protein